MKKDDYSPLYWLVYIVQLTVKWVLSPSGRLQQRERVETLESSTEINTACNNVARRGPMAPMHLSIVNIRSLEYFAWFEA